MAALLPADQFARYNSALFDARDAIGIPRGFGAFFGRRETGASTIFSPDANALDIDIQYGNQRLAAMIHRGQSARALGGQKDTQEERFTSISRKFPLVEETGSIGSDQLVNRLAGEAQYSTATRQQRMRDLAMNVYLENVRKIGRRFEELAAQSILTGKMTAIDGTTNDDLTYDFLRRSTHRLTAAAAWSNPATSILGDLSAACKLINADGYVKADGVLLGDADFEAITKNTEILNQADNRRFELIEVSLANPVPPRFAHLVEAGWNARGRLRLSNGGYELWMFTNDAVYTTAAGTAKQYMPDETAIVFFSGARCDRYFGPPDILPLTASKVAWFREVFGFDMSAPPMPMPANGNNVINSAMFYTDAYESGKGKVVTIRNQSAPIFATTMADAFVSIDTTP